MVKVIHNFARVSICIVCIIFLASLISLGLIFNSSINSAHAVSPQSVDYNVYIKPSLNVSVSSNNVVLNINPAGSLNGANNPNNFTSNSLNVSVATNNQYGYRLYMNSNTSDLVKTDDNTEIIPTLSTTTTESNFPYNKWGYKFSTDTDYQPFQANTNIPISSSDTATNEISTTLNFGAKANYDKKAGTYELDLNFKALPTVTTYYMQDIAKDSTLAESVCTEEPTVVIDKRDEKAYTIRRIGGDGTSANPGDCWMVENLQFTGTTMDSTTSNISPQYTPANPYVATYYDLKDDGSSGGKCYGTYSSTGGSGDGYIYSCIREETIDRDRSPIDNAAPTATTSTVFYNYAAATAGTITGSNNPNPQLYDICPAGWKIPNASQNESLAALSDATSLFSPVSGGEYNSGEWKFLDYAFWWSATSGTSVGGSTFAHYALRYHNNVIDINSATRADGIYIRCVLDNFNINDLSFMQDFARVAESDTATGDNKKQQIIDSMELNSTTGYTLKDIRDNQEYTINKIGPADNVSSQNVWMTKNLLFQGTTMTPDTSDVTQNRYMNSATSPGTYTNYSLKNNASNDGSNCYGTFNQTTPTSSTGAGYTNACMNYLSSDANIGGKPNAWYNYAAATAYTIRNAASSNVTTEATESICPKGWSLPTRTQALTIGGTNTYTTPFNPTKGGYMENGNFSVNTLGYWWTTTAYNNVVRYYIGTGNSDILSVGGSLRRSSGYYIRCVAK